MSLSDKSVKKLSICNDLIGKTSDLAYMYLYIQKLYEDECGHISDSYEDFLKSCKYKSSDFYTPAVRAYTMSGFDSKEVQKVLKYITETYICIDKEKKEFYKDRLECLMFSGTSSGLRDDNATCDSRVVSLIVRDNKTSKIFELGIPVLDNCVARKPEDIRDGIGKIRIWNLTPIVRCSSNNIEDIDIFHSNGTHLLFYTTYDPEECAQAIYDFLTTDKYNFSDIRKEFKSFIYNTVDGSVEYFPYRNTTDDICEYDGLHSITKKKSKEQLRISQKEIDRFVDICNQFLIERFDIRNEQEKEQNGKQKDSIL